MSIKKIIIFGLLLFLSCGEILAQKAVVFTHDVPSERLRRQAGVRARAADSATLALRLADLAARHRATGYAAFSIDSVVERDDRFEVACFVGPCLGDAPIRIADSSRRHLGRRPLRHGLRLADYAATADQTVARLENAGHPFASVSLRDVDLAADTVGTLLIEPGPTIYYDSVILKGNARLRPAFLRPYLGWRRRGRYAENVVAQVPDRLARLPYVGVTREPGVEFVGDRAYLYLFLDKRRVNSFDGYIGLVPVSENSGKTTVNGEANLVLQNLFTIGERIALQWRAPERYSQFLHLTADFPYLFGTPLGISGAFTLDKKDTSYLNMNYRIALQYAFGGSNDLRTYFQYTTSTVLSPTPSPIAGDTLMVDYRKAMYGIQLNFSKLDDVLHPWRGFSAQVDLSAGRRTLRPSAEASADVAGPLKSATYLLRGQVNGYVPFGQRWGWVGSVSGATQFGGAAVYNDLFRIGGTRTLQGFDELSIFASTYVIADMELRLRYARWSYLTAFFNAAWYERNLAGAYASDWPFGFGLGVTFNTKAGDLYFSYALGRQNSSGPSFKTGKIHFGIDVRF